MLKISEVNPLNLLHKKNGITDVLTPIFLYFWPFILANKDFETKLINRLCFFKDFGNFHHTSFHCRLKILNILFLLTPNWYKYCKKRKSKPRNSNSLGVFHPKICLVFHLVLVVFLEFVSVCVPLLPFLVCINTCLSQLAPCL